MILFPAIDLFEGKAVRLFKGDYAQMTVYNDNPVEVARDFVSKGATHIHLVDLEGAKSGTTPNLKTVAMSIMCIRFMRRIVRNPRWRRPIIPSRSRAWCAAEMFTAHSFIRRRAARRA